MNDKIKISGDSELIGETKITKPHNGARSGKEFAERILEVFKVQSELPESEQVYINPHMLSEISGLLDSYSGVEDDDVDRWVQDMFGW